MSATTMIVAIVAILAFAAIRIARLNAPHRPPPPNGASIDAAEKQALRNEVEHLHDRIRVLERIATEGETPDARETRRIAAEIEALRDRDEK